jgi:hypothetical protein
MEGKITKFRQYVETLVVAEARGAVQVVITSNDRALDRSTTARREAITSFMLQTGGIT